MSIFSRLRIVRFTLALGLGLRALVWGIVAALTVVLGGVLADHLSALTVGARTTIGVVAALAGLAVIATLVWRDRRVASLARVALWIEEQHPSLEYTLITAVETSDERIVPRAAGDEWQRTAARRSARLLSVPLVIALVAVATQFVLPRGAVARIRAPRPGDALERGGKKNPNASRLTPLVAVVTPPAYSAEPTATFDEPTDVRALVGSGLTLRGRGDPAGLVAVVGAESLHATADRSASGAAADRWSIALRVPPKAEALRLVDRGFARIVALEPIVDDAPTLTLVTPAHDSVLRTPSGRIALAADANDDYGISQASFEYIISSGEGETFTFKSGTLGTVSPHAKRASFSSTLILDSLGLKPGDIVHLRAIARDANDVTGPGTGTSETRAIRIARADEYDSVAVDAAPPSDADKSVVSERMLIVLAEALEKKRPTLKRDALVGQSHTIASDQKKLRRSVGDIVFARLGGEPGGEEHSDDESPARAKTMEELLARADSATNIATDPIDFAGGESPVVAVNKPLLEAYNAMWDASSELEIGEPGKALPHMRRALAAIQKARSAERIYLRGRPPQVVVDVNKARLQGKDKGASSTRRPLTTSDSATRARTDRFLRIVELAPRNSGAAVDSLLLLRVDALSDNPPFAAALSEAANAMRTGKSANATAALARARRALGGAPAARDSIGRWGTVP